MRRTLNYCNLLPTQLLILIPEQYAYMKEYLQENYTYDRLIDAFLEKCELSS